MAESEAPDDERRGWTYAFMILLLVSVWMLSMRLANAPLLVLDFEVTLVYLPTALAAIVVAYVSLKRPK
jgi:hypothetical protein